MQIGPELSIRGNGYIFLIGGLTSIILSGFYIYWWRYSQRPNKSDFSKKEQKYTPFQIAGAICIIFLLCPIYFAVAANIVEGAIAWVLFLLELIQAPKFLLTLTTYMLVPAGLFGTIIGSYHACEFVWPRKRKKT